MARLFNAALNIHYFISNNAVASCIFALAGRKRTYPSLHTLNILGLIIRVCFYYTIIAQANHALPTHLISFKPAIVTLLPRYDLIVHFH